MINLQVYRQECQDGKTPMNFFFFKLLIPGSSTKSWPKLLFKKKRERLSSIFQHHDMMRRPDRLLCFLLLISLACSARTGRCYFSVTHTQSVSFADRKTIMARHLLITQGISSAFPSMTRKYSFMTFADYSKHFLH